MTTIDYAFLAVCVVGLGLILAVSKVLRAVVWETLRYPFRASHVEVHQGQVVVGRSCRISEVTK